MERIVSKFGGTSNSTAEAVQASMELAADSQVVVASAPGVLSTEQLADFPVDTSAPAELLQKKVTQLLLDARQYYAETGELPDNHIEAITARYRAITGELADCALGARWVDTIAPRVHQTITMGSDYASMLGEQLQTEVYESVGFVLLDPSRAVQDLGRDYRNWGQWLAEAIEPGQRYIIGGNVSFDGQRMYSFGRGGSDTTAALVARALGVDACDIYSDTPLRSAHPDIVDPSESFILHNITYDVGRELGVNGTGLVHPDALAIMQGSGIPTRAKNTFGLADVYTTYHDAQEDEPGQGRPVAVSLMEQVTLLRVHEPGMRESQGRIADISQALANSKINLIDFIGDGADRDIIIVECDDQAASAAEIIRQHLRNGGTVTGQELALLTLAGYRLRDSSLEIQLRLNNQRAFGETKSPFALVGEHSLRFGIDRNNAREVARRVHNLEVK